MDRMRATQFTWVSWKIRGRCLLLWECGWVVGTFPKPGEKATPFGAAGDGKKRGPSSETKGEAARGRITHQSFIDINYESFIYKSSFLHSSSSDIKFKNVRLGKFRFWEYVPGHRHSLLSRNIIVLGLPLRTLGYLYHLPPSSLRHNRH